MLYWGITQINVSNKRVGSNLGINFALNFKKVVNCMGEFIKILLALVIIGSFNISCVPKRKLDDITANYNTEKAKSQELHSQNVQLEAQNQESMLSTMLHLN